MKKIIEKDGRVRVMTINDEPSKTQQQFKETVDVNNIIRRYKTTGQIDHLNKRRGMYLDSTNIPDYQTSLQTIIDAQASFSALPSAMRKRFSNDPGEMIKFLSDPKNRDEAINLGLVNPTPEPQQNEPQTKPKTKPKPNTPNPQPNSEPDTSQA